ncbi:alpha-1,3-mannosyl-glycoprotein 4-beta-N-acetylglucosaminyltransferase B-like isoform X1 [Daphnia pulicaria]|uniref:alpha-1,3-mannosyl-glycoprotein 4-beta-N-acetylglucosaminyltransferase B-like isoform X1 n=1 Tax=Daphnia pulicaria TaxID=35523 RepID=UPI001EEAEFB8|nr:alpha-1,3-mannosyl-glycoprotein 4-beta-N-acetylglucosaminyltransferase B-like isoform X1 [Daphnia pulicaria]
MLSGGRIFRKKLALALLVIFCVPFTVILLHRDDIDGAHLEDELTSELAHLRQRVSQVEMINQARRRDLSLLTRHVNRSLPWNNTNGEEFPELSRLLLDPERSQNLRLPNIFSFLPYLLNNPLSTVPAFVIGQGKTHASIVLGVPTVKRESQSYLLPTLASLIASMNEEEKNDTLIIVFVAETDLEYVTVIAEKIKKQFGDALQSGLLEIVSPPPSFYPDLNELRVTLNDPVERVKWRTKQNLDYAFLMMYAQSRGMYYVQLEDDILTTPGYITKMKKFALKKEAMNLDWFLLDFCQLGFIGKMFKSTDLPYIIQFAVMFHNDKPVDWLLDPIIETRYCPHDTKKCNQIKLLKWIHFKPSLFQHVGTTSSLKGKVQKLKDKNFGKLALFTPHKNPPAKVTSPIKAYKQFTIQRAYRGDSFFWGLMPQAGDNIVFEFSQPVELHGYRLRSGNYEHPSDLLYNTSVEIRPTDPERVKETLKISPSEQFIGVGEFNDLGIAEGKIDPSQFGQISAVRLVIKSASKNWVIISEIMFDTGSG